MCPFVMPKNTFKNPNKKRYSTLRKVSLSIIAVTLMVTAYSNRTFFKTLSNQN